jgi:hypothetical protein
MRYIYEIGQKTRGEFNLIYCSSCGKRAEMKMAFCPSCGQKLESNVFCLDDLSTAPDDTGPRAGIIAVLRDSAAQLPESPAQKPENDTPPENPETVYYSDEEGVCLTPTMLVVPGKNHDESPSTYALSNITSVKSEKDISARIIGGVGAVFGVVIIFARDYISMAAALHVGIFLILLGLLIAIFIRPTYHLKISGAHGEADVLKMSRKPEFDRIMAAINEALAKKA